jgi:AraC-like DNA-binding protein
LSRAALRCHDGRVIELRAYASERGHGVIGRCVVPSRLAGLVDAIWYSEGALVASRERLLPSGLVDVVANLGAPMALIEGRGERVIVGGVCSGLLAHAEVIEHPAVHRAVGIRLQPLGARRVLDLPLGTFSGSLSRLDDVLGAPGRELAARCHEARDPGAVLRAALAWVEQRLARSHAPDAVAPWTLSRMHAANGRIAVAELVRRSGMSARRFTLRFERELGVTPKVYLRLLRLRRTLAALTPGGSLAALAERMGYCDQAHMNREFRDLGGVTPTEVLRGRYEAGLTVAE